SRSTCRYPEYEPSRSNGSKEDKAMAEQTVPSPNGRQGSGDWEVTRAPERHVRPPVDIYETPDALMLIADMPGVSKESLEVRVDEDLLTIQGKATHAVPGDPVYREF